MAEVLYARHTTRSIRCGALDGGVTHLCRLALWLNMDDDSYAKTPS